MKSCAVIIPVLNGEKFISETIDSLLKQTYLPDEIIVVDNGSTDGTLKVLEKYRKDIISISEFNKGVAAARNTGIKYSKSELIAFLDADDICKPTRIENQLKLFEKDNSIAMVFGAYQYMDVNAALYDDEIRCYRYVKEGFFGVLLERNQILPSSVMIKKCVLEKINFFDESFLSNAEDYDLWLRIASKYIIKYQEEVLVYIRIHGNSSSSNREMQIENSIKAIKKYTLDEIRNALEITYRDKNYARMSFIKILFFIGMYDEAKEQLSELLELKFLLPDVYFILGNLLIKNEQLNEAKICYKQCLKLNRKYAEVYNNLGIIYSINNNIYCAKKMFKRALALKNYYSDPLKNIKNMKENESNWNYTFYSLRNVLKPSE